MLDDAIKAAWKEYLACPVLGGTNDTKFGSLKNKLESKNLLGHDNYPKDQLELLNILNKYKPEVTRIQQIHQKNTEGVTFIQAGKIDGAGKQDNKLNDIKDSYCGTVEKKQILEERYPGFVAVWTTTGSADAPNFLPTRGKSSFKSVKLTIVAIRVTRM